MANQQQIQEFHENITVFLQNSKKCILEERDKGMERILKGDKSIVTNADIAAERIIRKGIEEHYPSHGIFGEELPTKNPDSDFMWYIDPIDGTRNFSNNIPTYGTVIGLYYKGIPLAGGIDHPALDLTLTAARGEGSFKNGSRFYINETGSEISGDKIDYNQIISVGNSLLFERSNELNVFDKIIKCHGSVYIYHDIYASSLAILGSTAGHVEFNMQMWDLAASQVLVEEAGGRFVMVRYQKQSENRALHSFVLGKKKVVDYLVGLVGNNLA